MNKKLKIIVTTLSASAMVVLPCVTTIAIVRNKNYINNIKYAFLDQKFSTKKEAFDYANSITTNYEHKTKTPVKWSLNVNNELKTFENQKDILNYLNQFIDTKSYTSFTNDLKTDSIKALLPSEISKMNFNKNIDIKTIYRGKNNSIHYSEESAKKSYFQVHETYYFNGLFFRTKEELAIWLEKNITNANSNNQSVYEILFQDIDGNFSMPLKIEDLKKDFSNNQTPASIGHFVKTNNKPYFKYDNKELNKTFFVSESNLDEISKYYDSKYTQITSNQGKGNYIIDTSVDDEASLIGPYYIKAGTEIKQITDRTKWTTIKGTDYNIVNEMKEKGMISNFMNLLLANPYNESSKTINTFFSIKDIQDSIDNYFLLLFKDLPEIYKSLNNLYQTMKQGKRYGEFLKLPILFVHTIDQMIYYNVNQEYIDKTREIYGLICDYYDQQLYSMVPEKFLLKKNNEKFSFKKIFGVNNQNLDLNYDVDTLIGEVVYEYPNLLEFANFISYSEMILSKLNTLEDVKFSPNYFWQTYKLQLNPELINEYELVWNALSSPNFEILYENINKINNNIDPSKAYYYINNFILQQKSNDITKVIVSFWLDKNKAIQEFNLNEKEIEYLDKLVKNRSYNGLFNIKSIGSFFDENFEFLKKLYHQNNSVDPVLFSRLIMYMQYYNNGKKISELLNNQSLYVNNSSTNNTVKNINTIILKQTMTSFTSTTILKSYSFISSNNIVSSFSRTNINSISISKNQIEMTIIGPDTKAEKFMKTATGIYSGVTSIFNLISNKIQNGFSDAWDVAQFVLSIYKEIFNMLTLACPWFAIGSILCDFIVNFYKKETFSYIFETEDTKFIWNGGMQESWFYGLIPGKSTTIEDMKLLNPIEVIKPNNSQGYYYNGRVYGDVTTLEIKQLDDILNNRYSNNDLEKVYSLIELEKGKDIDSKFYSNSIETLLNNFSNHVNDVILNNSYDYDPIIKKSSYKFGSFIYDNNLTKKDNIQKVLDNIKPSLVAQLPILNPKNSNYANIPIFNNQLIGDDGSVSPYKLPGKSWTSNGGLQINEDQNYIIVDQNPLDNNSQSPVYYQNKLENNFMNSFDVLSKEVDSQFINSTNLYSELSTKIISNYCYIAKGKDNEINIFLTKNDAINWLLSEFEYQTYFIDENLETFLINDMIFNGYQQYINWVNNNIKEIK